MRLWLGLMLAAGLVVGVSGGQVALSAEADKPGVLGQPRSGAPNREQCAAFARQRKDLEKSGIRQMVEMSPVNVLSQYGADAARRVYAYIRLSEKVLFQCPPYVLNANVGPLNLRLGSKPPLPRKGPRRPKVKIKRSQVPIVPLPVRAPLGQSKRFEFPRSQG